MTKRRNLLIPLLAGATMLLGAHSALAGTDPPRDLADIRTTDANPGGKGYFVHRGDKLVLGACDIQRDGHGVNTYASYYKGGFQNLVRDGDGANNGPCHETFIQASAGKTIYVMVCLQDRSEGEKPHFCRTRTATA